MNHDGTNKWNPDTPEGKEHFRGIAEEMKQVTPEDAGEGFLIGPDRYYLAMWYVELRPELTAAGRGGNITFLAWRKLDDKRTWWFRFRFRYYTNMKAWTGEDTFKWYNQQFEHMDEEEVFARVSMAVLELSLASRSRPAPPLVIRGDDAAFHRAVTEQKPDWMQVKTMSADEKVVRT